MEKKLLITLPLFFFGLVWGQDSDVDKLWIKLNENISIISENQGELFALQKEFIDGRSINWEVAKSLNERNSSVMTCMTDISFLFAIYGNLDTEKSRKHTISYMSEKNETIRANRISMKESLFYSENNQLTYVGNELVKNLKKVTEDNDELISILKSIVKP